MEEGDGGVFGHMESYLALPVILLGWSGVDLGVKSTPYAEAVGSRTLIWPQIKYML